MTFRLNWKGKAVEGKVQRCEKQGINITMTEAVIEAKNNHPWIFDTGALEKSIQITQKATAQFATVVGQWGTKGVEYGIFLETNPKWMWLRPAADQTYPNLASNIKRCMQIG